ncbi:MAG TPA: hypothetical protein QF753_10880 [Victivallales bacterium]|nr:hypothetical protein [Victivallales bacterium]
MKKTAVFTIILCGLIGILTGCSKSDTKQTAPKKLTQEQKINKIITNNFTECNAKAIATSGPSKINNGMVNTSTEINSTRNTPLQTGFYANITAGELTYEVRNPDGKIIYSKTVTSSKRVIIKKSFKKPIKGKWTLTLKSSVKTTGIFAMAAQQCHE